MKRILLDTNIVLDIELKREPWFQTSSAVWTAIESGLCEGMLAAHAVTTIYYFAVKVRGHANTLRMVSVLLTVLKTAAVDHAVLAEALQLPFADFEDSVTATSARFAGCNYIVTRDPKGFRGSPVRALSPEEVLPLLGE